MANLNANADSCSFAKIRGQLLICAHQRKSAAKLLCKVKAHNALSKEWRMSGYF